MSLPLRSGALVRVSAHVVRQGFAAHWEFSATARCGIPYVSAHAAQTAGEDRRHAGGLGFASGSPGAILPTMTGRIRVSSARFVGRADELARLEGALRAAVDRRSATVVVGGEAGVGKTRLVQEFGARAQERGARVLAGGCIQLSGGGLPYGPVMEALRGLTRDLEPAELRELLGPMDGSLIPLLPTLERPPAGQLERPAGEFGQAWLFELLLRFLDRLSAQAPIMLIVEDLHWADQSTLDLLRFLVGMLGRERLLLIATYRSDELHSAHPLRTMLAELDRSRRVEHLQLPRFDREELAELLGGILKAPPAPEILDRVLSRSQGNAFIAEELIAAGDSEASGHLAPRLQGLLLARITALAEDTKLVLQVAATIGRQADHDLLVAASQLPQLRLLNGIREAVDRQVLVAEHDAYRFRHVLLQEAVYGELLPGERRRLHAAVAHALTENPHAGIRPATAAELSHHWYAARRYPQALTTSISAARAAAEIYGFTEADLQYERALSLWDELPDGHKHAGVALPDLRLEAAEAAGWSGLPDRAVTLIQEALADLDARIEPTRAGVVRVRLAEWLWDAGDTKAALAAYEEASRLVANEPASAGKARVLAGYGTELMRQGQYSASRVLCEEAIAVARPVGARAEEARALNTLGCDLSRTGDPQAGAVALRQALALAEETSNFDEIQRAYRNLSVLLGAELGRPHEAVQLLRQGLERMRQLGLAIPGNTLRSDLAHELWYLGRWQEAEELVSQVAIRELPARFALHLRLLQGHLHLAQGRFDLAHEQGQAAVRMGEQLIDPPSQGSLQAYLARLAISRGDYSRARSAVANALQQLAEAEDHDFVIALCHLGLRAEADAAEQAHDRRANPAEMADIYMRGQQLLTHARQALSRLGTDLINAKTFAAACEAEFSRLEFGSDPQQWAALAASWEAFFRPYEAAYARWRQAEALLTRRAPKAAASVLRQAHQAASDLGARPLRHEIERLAQRARIDLRTPSAKPGAAEAPSPAARLGLTPREQEVLQHLVEGRTNRQIARALFISEKTASVHVSHIMGKLGAANRAEAAAIAHRLRLLSEPLQAEAAATTPLAGSPHQPSS
jgi:predicted ATPase/DNA-binding CsgD family transcriptional regulator